MAEVKEARGVLRLGDILIEQGVITEQQLNESLQYQSETGARLGESLTALGHTTPDQIAAALAWQGTYGLVALNEFKTDPAAADLLTEKFCRARRVLPMRFNSRGTLLLAMVDPSDMLSIDDVRLITGAEISPVPVSPAGFDVALSALYGKPKRVEVLVGPQDDGGETRAVRESADSERVISLVDDILAKAVRQGASDVHFEPQAGCMAVRVRVDGILHQVAPVGEDVKEAVVYRLKIMADLDLAERRFPQEGRTTIPLGDRTVAARIATVPTVSGEGITVRLLDENRLRLGLGELGMEDAGLRLIRGVLAGALGHVLVTGPRGAGKTTTLYAGLEELNRPGVKIYTVEDPVQRIIPGITQSQIQPALGLGFTAMLHSLVHSDPDVIFISDIRDKDTALQASELAAAGHLVLSALHTADAPSAVTRMLEMGVPPYLVASGTACVVAQRLVRRICRRCRHTITVDPGSMSARELRLLGPIDAEISRAAGCKNCLDTGYQGRVGLFEILPVDDGLRDLILSQPKTDQVREYAVGVGMKTLRDDGRAKVLAGLTTAEEIERLTT